LSKKRKEKKRLVQEKAACIKGRFPDKSKDQQGLTKEPSEPSQN